jgi:DNA-binding protein HU-beta
VFTEPGFHLTVSRAVHSLAAFIQPPMNKAALVDEVQKILGHGTSKAAAERAVDGVLAGIKRGLKRDKEVSVVGFGTFALAVRPARNGYNPHTRQPMKIRPVRTIRFKPGAYLRSLA